MKGDKIWIEEKIDNFPISYPNSLVVVGGLNFLIFIFFAFVLKVVSLNLPPLKFLIASGINALNPALHYHLFINVMTSMLIPVQIAFTIYLVKSIKNIINNTNFESSIEKDRFYEDVICHLVGSSWRFIFIFSVIIPAFLILLLRIYLGENLYDFEKIYQLSNLYMFYQHILELIIFYLVATTIWIISNIHRCLNILSNYPYKDYIKIDIISLDNIGGLSPFKNLILAGSIYYSLSMSLAIFTFYRINGPIILSISGFTSYFSYEAIYLLALLIIGLVYLLVGLDKIRKLLTYRLDRELAFINGIYNEYYNYLLQATSKQFDRDNKEDLSWLRTIMDTLYDQKIKISSIDFKVFDLKSIISFSSSLILPILVKYLETLIFQA